MAQPIHQKEHPERMPRLKDITPALDQKAGTGGAQKNPADSSALAPPPSSTKKSKKAKWHLGIRSQSKPQDIMNEVFKAMKNSNMQWKYYNSSIYNLRVRKQVAPERYVKIGLQLYQVDQKSYLLDFRSFDPNDIYENQPTSKENGNSLITPSVAIPTSAANNNKLAETTNINDTSSNTNTK